MVVSGFVIVDVPKLVNGGAMVVSGYVLMLVMGEVRSPCCHIDEAKKSM
jgi:hypothetical protein